MTAPITGERAGKSKETLYVFDERESVWLSAIRDMISFGGLAGSAVAVNRLMPPSAWINAALAIAWILWLLGNGLKRRMEKTPSQAIIAAAPELYEALAKMVEFGEEIERKSLVGDEGCYWPVEIARAALAKAVQQ